MDARFGLDMSVWIGSANSTLHLRRPGLQIWLEGLGLRGGLERSWGLKERCFKVFFFQARRAARKRPAASTGQPQADFGTGSSVASRRTFGFGATSPASFGALALLDGHGLTQFRVQGSGDNQVHGDISGLGRLEGNDGESSCKWEMILKLDMYSIGAVLRNAGTQILK